MGNTLPKESELATHYGVNRSVVREAIKLLEVHRLVRPVKRSGTVVLDPLASMSPEVLKAKLMPRTGRVDLSTLEDLLEVRTHLDMQMTGLAAERRTDADLEELDACLEALGDHVGDSVGFAKATERLVLAVARASKNVLYEMLAHWNHRVQADLSGVFLAVRPANDAHVQGTALLIDLIRKRDVDNAVALVRTYHAWATPRWLAAAALLNGTPLDQIARGASPP